MHISKLNHAQLETLHFKATGILRGKMDMSELKAFSFGILFLKRLACAFDRKRAARGAVSTTTP